MRGSRTRKNGEQTVAVTAYVDPVVARAARLRALDLGVPVTRVVEDALRNELARAAEGGR